MGEHFAPSPQEGKGGSRQERKPRKDAAKRRKNNGRKASSKGSGAGKPADRAADNPRQKNANGRGNGAARSPSGNRRKGGWLGKTTYAALDLGTNNCRLLIARTAQDGFTVIDAFSRVVRLGEGLATSGRMSEEAMDRAVEALGVCADKLKRRNVVLARSVATEACRQAENGREFIDRVARETGIILDVIDPREEARLAVMGCHALLEDGTGPALIFDIGGGSTELVLVGTDGDAPEILDWVSVPWGVVSLTESAQYDHSTRESRLAGYAEMRGQVMESFADFASRLPEDAGCYRMMGTSGTVTTLSSVYLKLQNYDRNKVDGLHVATDDMRSIARKIAACSFEERAEYPTIGTDRADLVVAGCAILEAIFDIWPGQRLGVADRGIREGILRALMAGDGHDKARYGKWKGRRPRSGQHGGGRRNGKG